MGDVILYLLWNQVRTVYNKTLPFCVLQLHSIKIGKRVSVCSIIIIIYIHVKLSDWLLRYCGVISFIWWNNTILLYKTREWRTSQKCLLLFARDIDKNFCFFLTVLLKCLRQNLKIVTCFIPMELSSLVSFRRNFCISSKFCK